MIRNYNRGGAFGPKVKAAIDVVQAIKHYDKKAAIAGNAIDVASVCKSTTNRAIQRVAEADVAHDHALNTIQKFRRM